MLLLLIVCIACTALVKSYAGLVVCRFFLGITEAPFYPGATYMLSIFYTRKGMFISGTILTRHF
jgi:MFS family permease